MPTKLIKLQDGTLVEVSARENEIQEISGGVAEKVDSAISEIQPILIRAGQSVGQAWRELPKDLQVEQIEVDLALSFEGEGNIYIAKGKAGANIGVKLIINPTS